MSKELVFETCEKKYHAKTQSRVGLFSIGFNTPTLASSFRRKPVEDSSRIQNLDVPQGGHDKYLAACSEDYLFWQYIHNYTFVS